MLPAPRGRLQATGGPWKALAWQKLQGQTRVLQGPGPGQWAELRRQESDLRPDRTAH